MSLFALLTDRCILDPSREWQNKPTLELIGSLSEVLFLTSKYSQPRGLVKLLPVDPRLKKTHVLHGGATHQRQPTSKDLTWLERASRAIETASWQKFEL